MQQNQPACECGGCETLGEACLYRCKKCLDRLLWQARIFRDPSGRTGLMISAAGGFMAGVRALADQEKGMQTASGVTALQEAEQNGETEIMKFLGGLEEERRARDDGQHVQGGERPSGAHQTAVKQGPRIHVSQAVPGAKSQCGCSKYLKQAVFNQCVPCVERFIHQAGSKDQEGRTALMLAANAGCAEIVALLAPKEARMQALNGNTALILAAQHNRQDCVKVLLPLEHGICNSKNKTALAQVLSVKNFALAQTMFQDKAETDATDTSYLIAAVEQGCKLPYALYKRAFPGGREEEDAGEYYEDEQLSEGDYQGEEQWEEELDEMETGQCGICQNLLHAARRGCVRCTRDMLDEAGRVSDDRYAQTAMMIAAYKGFSHIVEVLAPYEARLTSAFGETALMQAAKSGSMQVVCILAKKEAGMRSLRGYTARRFAEQMGNAEVASYLSAFEK